MAKTGTKEWAAHTVNIFTGCDNGCLYCYARYNAIKRFKRVASNDEWLNPVLADNWEKRCKKKYKGRVMFPSTHDITKINWVECLQAIRMLVDAGNQVLVVTKPDLFVVRMIVHNLVADPDAVTFRFTIGSQENDDLRYWEPNAPLFGERFDSLLYAHKYGWNTSVSIEPMLNPYTVTELFHMLSPYVNDTIWIGKMNRIWQRVATYTMDDLGAVEWLEKAQCDNQIMKIYRDLKDEPKVRWKDSIKEVIKKQTADQ